MVFTLEALRAKHGDALLLHYGDPASPRLVMIDGGPGGVYRRFLRPRLLELRDRLAPDGPLPLRMVMVSHIDDDHINGVLDLTADLVEQHERHEPLSFQIETLWHNSFDDVVGAAGESLLTSGVAEVGAASVDSMTPVAGVLSREAAAVVASVRQGRQLRLDAEKLAIPVNRPGGGVIAAGDGVFDTVDLGDGVALEVLGPRQPQVEALQASWDQELERLGVAEVEAGRAGAAAMIDRSVFNLASLVVLVRGGSRTMLLTGDARGDHILESVRAAGLLDDHGRYHVDLFKLPHHGSDRNVDTDFFRAITADHYVISGDGRHGNPEPATFEMLFAARGDEPFTLHLSYPVDELGHDYPVDDLNRLFERHRAAGRRVEVRAPAADEVSLRVEL